MSGDATHVDEANSMLPLVVSLDQATTIVAAYLAHNAMRPEELPALIHSVHSAVVALKPGSKLAVETDARQPAVPIKKSVFPDHIVCLEDGKKLKMLKRHLATSYGMTPAQYRERWGLPLEYPMVAPNYAARRSDLAKKIGLGRKSKQPAAAATAPAAPAAAAAAPVAAASTGRRGVAAEAPPPKRGRPRIERNGDAATAD